MAEQRRVCQNCGTDDAEWRDDKNRLLPDPPYEVVSHRCAGCQAIEAFKTDQEVNKDPVGLYVALRPTSPLDDDIEEEAE